MNEKSQYVAPPPAYGSEHANQAPPTAPQQQPGPGVIYAAAPPAGQSWPQSTPTVIYVNSGLGFGPYPQRVICPICNADVLTVPEHTASFFTYMMSMGLCLVGCIPCCVLPFFMKSCQDVEHTCPSCNHKIGHRNRIWSFDELLQTANQTQTCKWNLYRCLYIVARLSGTFMWWWAYHRNFPPLTCLNN